MLLVIENLLTADELENVLSNIHDDSFVDGKTTAGWHARLVKDNTQMRADTPGYKEIRRIIIAAMQRSGTFLRGVRPKRIRPPLVSRYLPGMAYGDHVDDALMGGKEIVRSDVSMTLFLSEPADYGGGELTIQTSFGVQTHKLAAGSLITYPSTTLHRVAPVTNGVRLVAVTWVQSVIRDSIQREILFDLDNARRAIFEKDGKTPGFDLISKSHANLIRMWSEV